MANVSAPYNFVPLNKDVFFPPWANLVNHDMPFKKGLSGQIELEITAESPIFIRKPFEEDDESYLNSKKEEISKEFCHSKDKDGNKRYYIPGSSIRNMLRSVVEIIGFGKLNPNEFTNRRFGVRDFSNEDVYTLINETEKIKIGYLIKEGENYFIYDKGIPEKIHQNKIEYKKNGEITNVKELFDRDSNKKAAKNNGKLKNNAKTAKFKYNETKITLDSNKGGIVFTGQPTFNNLNKAKHNEFKIDALDIKNDKKYPITIEQYDDFKFIYGDYTGSKEMSKDWKMWKSKLKNGNAIPVFFRNEDEKIVDFGLSFLYKMLYKERIEKAISNTQNAYNNENYDLTEIMFGSIKNEKLKGRVQVKHAFSENAKIDREYKIVLASPKASFYPYYIKQDFKANDRNFRIAGKYQTYNDSCVKINGRKRYPLHPLNINDNLANHRQQSISTIIKPLEKDTVFNTNIHFHNLLPVELGALLSAITFHDTKKCRHNIGAAKPFGLGQIAIKSSLKNLKWNNENNSKVDVNYFLKIFETEISKKIKNWSKTPQLKELCTMASIEAKKYFNNFNYLQLRDFAAIKREKKALPRHSLMVNYSEEVKSLLDKPIELALTELEKTRHYLSKINDKIFSVQSKKEKGNKLIKPDKLKEKDYKLEEGDYVGIVKFYDKIKEFGYIIENKTKIEYRVEKYNLCENIVIKKGDEVIFNKSGKKKVDSVEHFIKDKHTID